MLKDHAAKTAVGIVVVAFVGFLLALLWLTRNTPSVLWKHHFTLQELGALGDSFAPITAVFATAAAAFSVLSYFKQVRAAERQAEWEKKQERQSVAANERQSAWEKEQRDAALAAASRQDAWEQDQRDKDKQTRFDVLFFRALEEYDRAFARMDEATARKNPGSTGQMLLNELREMDERGDIFPKDNSRELWREKLTPERFHPVQRFVNSVFAVILWLDEAALPGLVLGRWMRLFEDRMSGPEQSILRVFVQHVAGPDVKAAAERLRLFETEGSFVCELR
ncbi:hypothetical protein [Tahibacter sp.]|uniref:hypothetical protein n=1 Tax=Tahibacter sp. TaxID=2056211 RepID=UPI0028C39FD9|nr:hypothetical protein [Tahibacter sp.]